LRKLNRAPEVGATVLLQPQDSDRSQAAETDKDDAFRFRIKPSASRTCRVSVLPDSAPPHLLLPELRTVVRVLDTELEIRLVEGVFISGRVEDAEEAPVAGAMVSPTPCRWG